MQEQGADKELKGHVAANNRAFGGVWCVFMNALERMSDTPTPESGWWSLLTIPSDRGDIAFFPWLGRNLYVRLLYIPGKFPVRIEYGDVRKKGESTELVPLLQIATDADGKLASGKAINDENAFNAHRLAMVAVTNKLAKAPDIDTFEPF